MKRLQTCPNCAWRFRVQANNAADYTEIEAGPEARSVNITPDAARLRRLKRLCALRGNARQKEAAAALQAGEAIPRNVFYFWPPLQICPDCERRSVCNTGASGRHSLFRPGAALF